MKKIVIGILSVVCSMSLIACGAKEEATNVTQDNIISVEPEMSTDQALVSMSPEQDDVAAFSQFAGDYDFSSGAGAWGTYLKVNADGTFEGDFHDSDMGDMGEGYSNGTVYCCVFSGAFSDFVQVDDYTFTAKIGEMNISTATGTEEIIDEIRYVYTKPYGLENVDVLEFYLPGKPIKELTEEVISWSFLRWGAIYPTTLPYKAICNVAEEQLFNGNTYTEEPVEKAEVPESLYIYCYDLAGAYVNDNGSEMDISIYTDIFDISVGDEIGNITWVEPDDGYIYSPEALVLVGDNGFVGKTDYSGEYQIIITDDTPGAIVFDVYDDTGYNCGTYKMIRRFES